MLVTAAARLMATPGATTRSAPRSTTGVGSTNTTTDPPKTQFDAGSVIDTL